MEIRNFTYELWTNIVNYLSKAVIQLQKLSFFLSFSLSLSLSGAAAASGPGSPLSRGF